MSCASFPMATAACGWCGHSRSKPTRTGSSSIATSTWMIYASTRRRRCAVRPDPRPVQPSTVLARSIGIGGHLAVPPLPHHRAYGSVPRRFGGLSACDRLHGDEPMILEASVGEGAVQRARRTQSPWSLRAEDGRTGPLLRDPEALEFLVASATRLPLDPDDATQARSCPAVQRFQLAQLAEAEVAGPSPQQRVQVGDHPLEAHPAMSPCQVANPVLEPGQRLLGDASPRLRFFRDREAKERALPRPGNGTLPRIDLKLEASLDEASKTRHHAQSGLFAADVDVAVVRITHKPVPTTLKLAIQFIQHEVR